MNSKDYLRNSQQGFLIYIYRMRELALKCRKLCKIASDHCQQHVQHEQHEQQQLHLCRIIHRLALKK